jgi:hypothetical protein
MILDAYARFSPRSHRAGCPDLSTLPRRLDSLDGYSSLAAIILKAYAVATYGSLPDDPKP